MDLNALESQMNNTEGLLSQYGADLPSEMQSQIQQAYTPILQESLGVTQDQMGSYLGDFMETTGMGPGMAGTTARDLSPTQKMGVIGRELGTMSGQLNASSRYSDYLGGQMNDLYQKAVQASQLGQQNLADQYARESQRYQIAWQEAENAKDRALQLQIANANRPQPIPQPQPIGIENDEEPFDIEVDDRTGVQKLDNWTDTNFFNKSSGLFGSDFTKWNQMGSGQKALALSSLYRPAALLGTAAKTGTGLLTKGILGARKYFRDNDINLSNYTQLPSKW